MATNFNAGYLFPVFRLADSLTGSIEHIGLLPNQPAFDSRDQPTASMHPAPEPHQYDFGSESDKIVEDVLSDQFQRIWTETARTNRAAFEKIFKPVPNDTIRSWKGYVDYIKPHAGISVSN